MTQRVPLGNGGSQDFYRAGGSTWTVTEGAVANYQLAQLSCSAQAPGGGPGSSTVDVSGDTASIHPVASACVYTNRYVPPHGGLTIRKVSRGGVGQFAYTVTPVTARPTTRTRPRPSRTSPSTRSPRR